MRRARSTAGQRTCAASVARAQLGSGHAVHFHHRLGWAAPEQAFQGALRCSRGGRELLCQGAQLGLHTTSTRHDICSLYRKLAASQRKQMQGKVHGRQLPGLHGSIRRLHWCMVGKWMVMQRIQTGAAFILRPHLHARQGSTLLCQLSFELSTGLALPLLDVLLQLLHLRCLLFQCLSLWCATDKLTLLSYDAIQMSEKGCTALSRNCQTLTSGSKPAPLQGLCAVLGEVAWR